jgi:hypothetical protein
MDNGIQPARFQCAGCSDSNETTIDPSGERRQECVEDCHVCCKPDLLRVECGDGERWVSAGLE